MSKDPDTGQRLAILLKSPRAFAKSTRNPGLLKIISIQALFFIVLTLELFQICTRRPVRAFLRVSPRTFLVFMF
jgi:hypothetical protein